MPFPAAHAPPPPIPGQRRCTRCGKVKVLAAYYRRADRPSGVASWCKTCVRMAVAEYHRSPEYRARVAEYRDRPEVRERMRAQSRRRDAARKAHQQAYRRGALGKLLHNRAQQARRLRKAVDPAKVARLAAQVAAYDREIARLRAARDDDD